MKKFAVLMSALCMLLCIAPQLKAQDADDDVPERLKYFKEKYIETYKAPFDVVWNAIKENLAALPANVATEKYSQTDEGLYKGMIRSDNYVFCEGSDTTYRTLQKYQYDMKFIPGSVWENGRLEYKFILKEIEPEVVEMTMTTKMSGHESHVTSIVHFFKSNGLLEKDFLDKLAARIKAAQE